MQKSALPLPDVATQALPSAALATEYKCPYTEMRKQTLETEAKMQKEDDENGASITATPAMMQFMFDDVQYAMQCDDAEKQKEHEPNPDHYYIDSNLNPTKHALKRPNHYTPEQVVRLQMAVLCFLRVWVHTLWDEEKQQKTAIVKTSAFMSLIDLWIKRKKWSSPWWQRYDDDKNKIGETNKLPAAALHDPAIFARAGDMYYCNPQKPYKTGGGITALTITNPGLLYTANAAVIEHFREAVMQPLLSAMATGIEEVAKPNAHPHLVNVYPQYKYTFDRSELADWGGGGIHRMECWLRSTVADWDTEMDHLWLTTFPSHYLFLANPYHCHPQRVSFSASSVRNIFGT